MIIDTQGEFSDAQAITATAASTNVIDFTGKYVGEGNEVPFYVAVQEDFAALTSLAVAVQTSPDNSTWTTVYTSFAIPVADLVAGYRFTFNVLPNKLQRYVRLNYVVAGDNATAGAVDAAIVYDLQTNQVY